MSSKNSKQFPLPPRKDKAAKPKRRRPLYRRTLRAVTTAPGKLLQRVNQELYRRNAELAARNKTLALLRKLDEISLAAVSPPEMANRMASAIAEALGYDLVSIISPHAQSEAWQTIGLGSSVPWIKTVVEHLDPKILQQPLISGPVATAIETGKMQFTDNPDQAHAPALIATLRRADQTPNVEEIKYSLLFPLRFGRETIGVLKISASRSLENISPFEQDSITGLIGLVSLALYKAKIYEDLQVTSAKLEEANDQLKDLDKANKEFLSLASHQLYTPVTALKGYLSMIQEGDFGPTPEKFTPIIEILRKSTEHLINLIKQYLDISRIEAGRLELNLESLDMVEISKQIVQDLMPNAMNKHLQLEMHEPLEPVSHVVADQERIRQVMLNFIDNAVKYTTQGSIHVRVVQTPSHVVFLVTDSGRGMTKEETEKLFVKFTRVGGEGRFRTEGTGLGLYLAGKIVREHHGEVKAESRGLNQGSTFSMLLPVEGTPASLKVGDHTSVEIKAAESKKDDS